MAGMRSVFKRTRLRELGVFLRNVKPEHIEHGELMIFKASGFSKGVSLGYLGRIRVKYRVDQRTKHSVRVFTNITVNETDWYSTRPPFPNEIYCCNLTVNLKIVASGCLQFRPRWMEELLPELGKLRLRSMAIPGTHHSGTYRRASDYSLGQLLFRYTYRDCQEEDIYHQLLYGIRSLDLRPWADEIGPPEYDPEYKFRDRYWYHYTIRHFYATRISVRHILKQVNDFLDNFKKEVVIIDFHEFPKGFFRREAFLGLEELVNAMLGKHIYRDKVSPASMTLEEVIQRGQRAIVTFEKDNYLREKFLPGVYHLWADNKSLTVVREFLREEQKNWRYDVFFSAMAHTTAGRWAIFADEFGGVRGQAHDNNLEISDWYAEDEEMRENAYIIAVDYFASSDIIDICLSINRERMKNFDYWNDYNDRF